MNPTAAELGIQIIDLTATDLTVLGAVELRKLGAQAGIRGAAKGRKNDLALALAEIKTSQLIAKEKEEAAKAAAAPAPAAKKCIVCAVRRPASSAQRKVAGMSKDHSDMCAPCYEEGGWENTHADYAHAEILEIPEESRTDEQRGEIAGCWICFPELNEAKKAPREGRSRAGMVIVARGTEIHKSETFRTAAERAGWTVKVMDTYEGTEGEEARYVATATKGNESISLAWDGRAYDYAASSAVLNGKARKVRNLKEALRLL